MIRYFICTSDLYIQNIYLFCIVTNNVHYIFCHFKIIEIKLNGLIYYIT